MDLLSSHLLLIYINFILAILILGLWMMNRTKRHHQWMRNSLLLGLIIGPVILISLDSLKPIQSFTLLNGNWSLIEVMLFSGLAWSLASTWLISLKRLPAASVEVSIRWPFVAIFYLILLISVWVGNISGSGSIVTLIGAIGLLCIVLSARQSKLLLYSAVSGVLFSLLAIVVSALAAQLHPQIEVSQLPYTMIPLAFTLPHIITFGMLVVSAPIVSHWWFNQELTPKSLK